MAAVEKQVPAEIWRNNDKQVSKVFVFDKMLTEVELDPYLETADTDRSNNHYPRRVEPSRFEMFQMRRGGGENPMQRQRRSQGE